MANRKIFNRTYQIRSRRSGMVSVGEVIQELVERAAEKQNFYRPAKRVSPKATRAADGVRLERGQLELPFPPAAPSLVERDPERPLFDLFPEAYE